MLRSFRVLGGALVLLTGVCAGALGNPVVTIDWVAVGDPGNAGEQSNFWWHENPTYYGGVDYTYAIGKFEVTNAQYCTFLNAVAASDPYGLWDPNMNGTGWDGGNGAAFGGITRTGSPGNFCYSTISGRENWPVNYVCWTDCARFVNWLNNGQPAGACDATTTEDGAYDLTFGYGSWVTREPDATIWLPSENEWYKAAYYKGGSTNEYWLYATQTDTPPVSEDPPGGPDRRSANYGHPKGERMMTDVGAYTYSPSPYGAFDMNGNVNEWNDTLFDSDATASRGYRGGSTGSSESSLRASVYSCGVEWTARYWIGFRVAGSPDLALVPEPFSVAFMGSAFLGTLVWHTLRLGSRKRRKVKP